MVAGTQVWPKKGTGRTRVPGALDTRPPVHSTFSHDTHARGPPHGTSTLGTHVHGTFTHGTHTRHVGARAHARISRSRLGPLCRPGREEFAVAPVSWLKRQTRSGRRAFF